MSMQYVLYSMHTTCEGMYNVLFPNLTDRDIRMLRLRLISTHLRATRLRSMCSTHENGATLVSQ